MSILFLHLCTHKETQYNKRLNMSQLVLRPEILEKLRTDPILFGKVAEVVGKSLSYTLRLISENDSRLTTASTLRVIKDHIGGKVKDTDLLMETQTAA